MPSLASLGALGPVGPQGPRRPQLRPNAGQTGPVGPLGPQGPGIWNSLRRQTQQYAKPKPAGGLLANAGEGPGGGSYADAFNASLARSRSGIEQQFQSALQDISQREGLANQAVGLLPGQVQGVYDRGDANLTQAQGALDSAQQAANLTSYAPASAQMAPILAARGQDLAARQADVPLLQLGTQQAFSQQRGSLNQARLGAMGDLDSEERSFTAQRAGQEADQTSQLLGQDWLAEQDFGRQKRAAGVEGKAAMAEEGRSLNTFGAADTSDARGQWLRSYDPGTYKRIVGSNEYRQAESQLGGAKSKQGVNIFSSGPERYDVGDVVSDLERRGLYRTAAIFAYRHKKGQVGGKKK